MSDILSDAARLLRTDPSLIPDFLKTLPSCLHEKTEILWEEDSSSSDIGEIRWCSGCGAYSYREWHGSEDKARWVSPGGRK